MKNFWDQTGALWMKGTLVGKVGSVFSSTATQHGGQETTIISAQTMLQHHGLVIVGLPYAFQGQMRMDEIVGGSPYGATTITGGDGSRQPSATELEAPAGKAATSPKSPPSSPPDPHCFNVFMRSLFSLLSAGPSNSSAPPPPSPPGLPCGTAGRPSARRGGRAHGSLTAHANAG